MFTKDWWKATGIRVARTMAQALITAIGADYVGWLGHWYQIVILTGTMGLLAFATSIAWPPPESK